MLRSVWYTVADQLRRIRPATRSVAATATRPERVHAQSVQIQLQGKYEPKTVLNVFKELASYTAGEFHHCGVSTGTDPEACV